MLFGTNAPNIPMCNSKFEWCGSKLFSRRYCCASARPSGKWNGGPFPTRKRLSDAVWEHLVIYGSAGVYSTFLCIYYNLIGGDPFISHGDIAMGVSVCNTQHYYAMVPGLYLKFIWKYESLMTWHNSWHVCQLEKCHLVLKHISDFVGKPFLSFLNLWVSCYLLQSKHLLWELFICSLTKCQNNFYIFKVQYPVDVGMSRTFNFWFL